MFVMTLVQLILVTVLVLVDTAGSSLQTCRWKTYEEPGDINFAMIISVRSPDLNGTCGDVNYNSLQHVLTVKYAIRKLNGPGVNTNQSLVPGVKLGFTVFDDCGQEKYATGSAMTVLKRQFPVSIVEECATQNSPVLAGFIGPSRSQTATAVSALLKGSTIPLIGMTTTLSELSNKTKYPNVVRTAVSDEEQSKAIVLLAKRLGWSVIAILHTEDNYGENLSVSIQRLAKEKQICVLHVSRVGDLRSLNRAVKTLLEKQRGTAENSLGVVYLGQSELITNLMNSLRTEYNDNKDVKRLQWILPDSVGADANILKGYVTQSQQDHLGSVWSISPKTLPLSETGRYIQSVLTTAQQGLSNDTIHWVDDFIRIHCNSVFAMSVCKEFKQNSYLPNTIHAVYAMSLAIRKVHHQLCGGRPGMCEALTQKRTLDLLNPVRNIAFRYADLDENHTVPVLAQENISISFDANGDVEQEPGDDIYFINKYIQGEFVKIGSFTEDGTLKVNQATAVTSSCGQSCQVCAKSTQFMYLPGDILLAGFFSLHWAPSVQNPFSCGTFRTEVHTVISVEAFFYTIKKMSEKTGFNFGGIIFDDCYNFLKADSIIAKYFSGDTPLVDPNTGETIDFSKVVGVIGSESSAVSLPIAESFTRLRIPVITPASTTPDYDDKTLYPYSLRTVISDRITAEVIIAVAKHFGWTYVNIIYSNNIYGYKAMLLVKKIAREASICVANPIPIEITPQEKDLINIVKTLNENGARVVVFIGLEEDIKAFQNVIKYHKIELVFVGLEDFAVSLKPNKGSEKVTAGSLVVLPMPPRLPWNDFPDYLVNRKPVWTKTSVWFDRFWQSHFRCSLPGRFENLPSTECDDSNRINIVDAREWANQFRVGNTINAVASMIKGVVEAHQSFCFTQTEFACHTYKENPANVTSFIKAVTLGPADNPYRPYQEDGNGNLDFHIHNLQDVGGGSYEYIKVGTYSSINRQLTMLENSPSLFYENDKVVSNVNGACTVEAICKTCSVPSEDIDPISGGKTSGNNGMLVAILVVLCIVCIIVIAILLYLILQRSKNHTLKQQEKGSCLWMSGQESHSSIATTDSPAQRELPIFQNPRSHSVTTYASQNASLASYTPNGTVTPHRAQHPSLTQVPEEESDVYLHASSSIVSSADHPRRTEQHASSLGNDTTRPTMVSADRIHPSQSEPSYLYLNVIDDRTKPKVLAGGSPKQYTKIQPVAHAHPLRMQRQIEQLTAGENTNAPLHPATDKHETVPKSVVGQPEASETSAVDLRYVDFEHDHQTHPKQTEDIELPRTQGVEETQDVSATILTENTHSSGSQQTDTGTTGDEPPSNHPTAVPSSQDSSVSGSSGFLEVFTSSGEGNAANSVPSNQVSVRQRLNTYSSQRMRRSNALRFTSLPPLANDGPKSWTTRGSLGGGDKTGST